MNSNTITRYMTQWNAFGSVHTRHECCVCPKPKAVPVGVCGVVSTLFYLDISHEMINI